MKVEDKIKRAKKTLKKCYIFKVYYTYLKLFISSWLANITMAYWLVTLELKRSKNWLPKYTTSQPLL